SQLHRDFSGASRHRAGRAPTLRFGSNEWDGAMRPREFCRRWLVTLVRNAHGKAARRLCSDALLLACLAEVDLSADEFRSRLRELAADNARPNLARSARWALRAWLAAQRQPCPPTIARPA